MSSKHFKFEDLQPHVDMLCDALENKGASSSGIPNLKVAPQAAIYRSLLNKIRNREISGYELEMLLGVFLRETLELAKGNQYHRIEKIVFALDIFIRKEYNKVADEISNKEVGQA
jgi:hypothetical protein